MLLALHVIVSITSIISLLFTYSVNFQKVVINPFSYLLFFGVFYLSIPSIVFLYSHTSPLIGAINEDNLNYISSVSLYTIIVFLLGFIISFKLSFKVKEINLNIGTGLKYAVLMAMIAIVAYVIMILIFNYDTLIEIYGNRRLQADFNTILISKYKVYFLFNILCIFILFLYFATKKYTYLIFLVPYFLIDVILSSRYLILNIIIFSLIIGAYHNKKILNVKKILLIFLILVGFGLMRSTSINNINLEDSLLEFLFTYSSSFLLIESSYQSNIIDTLAHAISKLFLFNPYELLTNNTYVSYKETMSELNPIKDNSGLGGALITEIISFKDLMIIGLIPICISLYAFLISYFLRSNILWLRIYGVLFILFIFNFFRGSMFEHLFYPFYLMVYFGFWVFMIDAINNKMRRLR